MTRLYLDPNSGLELPVHGTFVTQGYGPENTDPSVRHLYRKGYHTGIDISGVPENTPVLSPRDGKVVHNSDFEGKGNCVILELENGDQLLFGHLFRAAVTVGDWVVRGQEVGGIGTTGVSTGVHLHFEVRRNGDDVDPTPYLAALVPEEIVPTVPLLMGRVKEDLNLRAGPSKNDAVLMTLPAGTQVQIGQDGWLPVFFEGRQGWMWAEFLEVGVAPSASVLRRRRR